MGILYGSGCLYSDCSLYAGPLLSGTWEGVYSFTYVAGTTVYVNLTAVATLPGGSTATYYAGESTDTYQEITEGVASPVLFTSTTSGTKNLYVKIELTANSPGLSPVIDSISLVVSQQTSLYTVAVQVLSDGLEASATEYYIDPWLQEIPIEYSWFSPVKHRTALAKIGDACGGIAYQDRNGVVRIEGAGYLTSNGISSVATVDQDRILEVSSPASEVFNRIQVKTQPYTALTSTEVWVLDGDNSIDNGESRTFEVFFNDYDAVLSPSASLTSSPAGATITSENLYTWGGSITVLGSSDGQTLTLTVDGQPLAVRGSRLLQATDGESARINGEITYRIDGNQLIQDPATAQEIADTILSETKDNMRDIDTTWRGDPSLELGDIITFDGELAIITEQTIDFNGALSATMRLKRIT